MARVLTGVGVSLAADAPKLKPEQQALYVRRGLLEFNPARHDFGDEGPAGRTDHRLGTWRTGSGLGPSGASAGHGASHLHQAGALLHWRGACRNWSSGCPRPSCAPMAISPRFWSSSSAPRSSRLPWERRPRTRSISPSRPCGWPMTDAPSPTPPRSRDWLGRMGQGLYGRETPDGYPLDDTAWTGPGQLTTLFEVAQQIGSSPSGLFKARRRERRRCSGVSAVAERPLLFEHPGHPQRPDQGPRWPRPSRAGEWNSLLPILPRVLHR
jgi:hypothetical protein